MFDEVPADQLHQFIAAASRASVVPFPLSFSTSSSSSSLHLHHHHHHHHHGSSAFPASFDPFSSTTTSQQVQQPHQLLHSLPQQKINEEKEENRSSSSSLVGMNLEVVQRERLIQKDPAWSLDELLALLRIRSSLENWFPELTWEHVSRRLEELGYKRSAEKCKEKFEEESRNFSNINYNKNYRTLFSEFDDDEEQELYHRGQNSPHGHNVADEANKKMDQQQPREEEEEEVEEEDKIMEQEAEHPRNDQTVANKSSCYHHQDKEKLSKGKKKRKFREKNFERFKGFCEDIVKKMMAQQEEMHNKLIEDLVKRDEEKVAREEAWKKQQIDRFNKELEIRASEQAITSNRQATIIKFLTRFSSSSSSSSSSTSEESGVNKHKVPNYSIPNPLPSSNSLILAQKPNQTQNPRSNLAPTSVPKKQTSSTIAISPQNPSSAAAQNKPLALTSTPIQISDSQKLITSDGKDDIGKRWPRDEVFALINLRCNLYNNGEDKEGAASRVPLWERISQGMSELGYKRSAKRCKEKWENINKYFRKTKDANKKRSIDSRTCPYFHQLSTLYNQGTLVAPSDGTENRPTALPENHHGSSQGGNSSTHSTMPVAQGDKNLVQISPALDFEF
ncbi:trihelix transcription factor GTL2 [Citrus sinensis]|nr:trihelix transcription factor GTL2 [Citrus x clementina]KAH9754089.1 trihelix transcription factor GTL2 [Citrus sinensis]